MRIAYCRSCVPMEVIAFGNDISLPMDHVDPVTGLTHADIGIYDAPETMEFILKNFSPSDALKFLYGKYGPLLS